MSLVGQNAVADMTSQLSQPDSKMLDCLLTGSLVSFFGFVFFWLLALGVVLLGIKNVMDRNPLEEAARAQIEAANGLELVSAMMLLSSACAR
jgi:hypothetical protein